MSKNSESLKASPEAVESKIAEETSLGRIAGPFNDLTSLPFSDFKVTPLALREKEK